jgi:hypothetical protein
MKHRSCYRLAIREDLNIKTKTNLDTSNPMDKKNFLYKIVIVLTICDTYSFFLTKAVTKAIFKTFM